MLTLPCMPFVASSTSAPHVVSPSCLSYPFVITFKDQLKAPEWSGSMQKSSAFHCAQTRTFQISSHNGRSDQGCENVIMLITDGAPNNYKEIFDLYNKDKKVGYPNFNGLYTFLQVLPALLQYSYSLRGCHPANHTLATGYSPLLSVLIYFCNHYWFSLICSKMQYFSSPPVGKSWRISKISKCRSASSRS